MKQSKNVRLLISLTVLVAITAVVLFLNFREKKEAIDPMMFRLPEVTTINEVTLERQGKTIDLKFDGAQWKINGVFEADPQLIKVLMATILQVAPKRPVAKQQIDTVKAWLARSGVNVKFLSNGITQKEFVAGGNPEKTEAYFQQPDGSLWRVSIPGYRVYAAGIFEVNEVDWREKRIFNFNWRNFRKLAIQYPGDPKSDFEIVRQEDFLGIVGLDKPDSTRINTFLNDVLVLTADKIAEPGTDRSYDSIVHTKPFLSITVEDIAKRSYRLDLFAARVKGGLVAGLGKENQIVLFDRKKTFPVVKKKEYFRAK